MLGLWNEFTGVGVSATCARFAVMTQHSSAVALDCKLAKQCLYAPEYFCLFRVADHAKERSGVLRWRNPPRFRFE
jgi:aspartate-semialdehyde dehydrogenase